MICHTGASMPHEMHTVTSFPINKTYTIAVRPPVRLLLTTCHLGLLLTAITTHIGLLHQSNYSVLPRIEKGHGAA